MSSMIPVPVLTPSQAAAWDAASEQAGIAAATLMETAGRAVASVVAERFAEAVRHGVLVAAGPGNNGGDGWVLARALHRLGAPVWVAGLPAPAGTLAAAMADRARSEGVREVSIDGPWPAVLLLVDAILGTGARGAPRGPALALAERLADLALPLVAIDGPTGLDLADGVQHGPVRAQLTVTFGGYRRGQLLARDEVGDLVVVDIGFALPDPSWPVLFTDLDAARLLPEFTADMHKGDRGRIAVVGGGPGLTGAGRLAARAAFAAGAGQVHLIAPESSVAVFAAAEPDLQTVAQVFEPPLGSAALTTLERAAAVIVGPGLGLHPERHRFVREILARAPTGVVDADGLSAFTGRVDELRDAIGGRPVVITPHLGEFRGLFPDLASGAAVDPWKAAATAAERLHATVLLKGVPTVVAGTGGTPVTVASGNPGLATGGSGDTLSGLIATFLAQGLPPVSAAALGAHVMGAAADVAALRNSARGMRPTDVIAAVPEIWRGWRLRLNVGWTIHPPVLHQLERPRHQ
jgi:NAD(P)H-hydrate epimerase